MKKIIVITGASGVGKTTVSHYLTQAYQIPSVVTHTTRPQRAHEQNGVDYYFETPQSFLLNDYLEQVTYAHHQYGSSRQGLQRAFAKAEIVSIVLDTKGALTYLKAYPQQVVIWFITADSQVLRQRLLQRGDQTAAIHERLTSQEFARDLRVPKDLKAAALVLVNDSWPQLKQTIDQLITKMS